MSAIVSSHFDYRPERLNTLTSSPRYGIKGRRFTSSLANRGLSVHQSARSNARHCGKVVRLRYTAQRPSCASQHWRTVGRTTVSAAPARACPRLTCSRQPQPYGYVQQRALRRWHLEVAGAYRPRLSNQARVWTR